MKLHESAIFTDLINDVDTRRDQLVSNTGDLPETRGAYMDLPLKERMDMARNVMAKYAKISNRHSSADAPGDGWPASVTYTTDRPDMVMDTVVGFSDQEGRPTYGDDYEILKYPDISVWARARNTENGIRSGYTKVGRVIFGPYQVDDGSKYGKWVRETHAEVIEQDPDHPHRVVRADMPLDSPEVTDLIAVIDEATGDLLEGVVARHRCLGATVIEHAAD